MIPHMREKRWFSETSGAARLCRVSELAKEYLAKRGDQSVSNRIDHLERTSRRAEQMAKVMSKSGDPIDIEVVKLAAMLHDIDEPYTHDASAVNRSIVVAERILRQAGYPQKRSSLILRAIAEHSSERPTKSTSIESDIVYDADKIDGLGATGIARVFSIQGQQGHVPSEAIAWYRMKMDAALPNMRTELGKRVVAKRVKYVQAFIRQYEKEQKRLL